MGHTSSDLSATVGRVESLLCKHIRDTLTLQKNTQVAINWEMLSKPNPGQRFRCFSTLEIFLQRVHLDPVGKDTLNSEESTFPACLVSYKHCLRENGGELYRAFYPV